MTMILTKVMIRSLENLNEYADFSLPSEACQYLQL